MLDGNPENFVSMAYTDVEVIACNAIYMIAGPAVR
jgi:hypothetical protein